MMGQLIAAPAQHASAAARLAEALSSAAIGSASIGSISPRDTFTKPQFCTRCGAGIEIDASFCGECGTAVAV
jgi:hypothetical protein